MEIGYNIKPETMRKWLIHLFELSDAETLENAVTVSKMIAQTENEIEVSRTVAVLYRAECSGEIDPPIAMRALYAEIVRQARGVA